MSNPSPLFVLLKFYASRLNTATVDYYEFTTYVKKYSQIHVEEQPDLVCYLGNADAQIDKDLAELSIDHQILVNETDKKRTIFVVQIYVQKFAKIYRDINVKPVTPFPTINDLPKALPTDILNKVNATDYLHTMLKKQELNEKTLYCLSLPHDTPAILVPSSLPVETLGEICVAKIRQLLQKDEYHDYFQKKLRISNSGKEIATKSFFDKLVNFSDNMFNVLKNSSDSFYFWSQLCYFIRQDFESIKDLTSEDINVLQAVYISEIITSFYKDQLKNNKQREEGLELLVKNLKKAPFFFSMDSVLNFTNEKGVLLRKFYSDNDLKNFLEKETSEAEEGENSKLPRLLVFKISNGMRFFIYKECVLQLITRLCNEAHDSIGKVITDQWVEQLRNFEKTNAMTQQNKFEDLLRSKTESMSPVLYALLNANFLLMLTYELKAKNTETFFTLFEHDRLLPYSHLLLLNQHDLLSNAKILLPFWYSIPVLNWIGSLFFKKQNGTKNQPRQTSFQKISIDEHKMKKAKNPREALSNAAQKIEEMYVQDGSSLDRELSSYSKIWNTRIDKKAQEYLLEDVNALIRDYIRNVLSTLNGVTFTEDRLENLAETLCRTPNMKKIGEPEALQMYVKLYILLILKNLA